MSIHPVALSGFATDSANYDASRPDHQAPAVARLLQELAIPKGGRVVEVGSGTGKLTSHLIERSDNGQIICVEPSEDMRTVHKKRQPTVDIRAGTAYELPVEDSSVDAIICAQAFHWFANADALKEFARALKPGGGLGLIWNFYDTETWGDHYKKIFVGAEAFQANWKGESWTHEDNSPQYRKMEWLKAFEIDVAKEYYVLPLQHWDYKWTRYLSEDAIWNFIRSLSFINRMPQDKKESLRKHIEETIKEADKAGHVRRNEQGLIELPSKTDVRWIKRR